MATLPIPPLSAALAILPEPEEQVLARAFAEFGRVAESLERSYLRLQAEVVRLREELETSQSQLVDSRAENERLQRERETLLRRQALAEMAAILAHEIRNPLGSMELFAGLLADADLSPQAKHWVGHLQAGLRTLAATVNNVLQFHSAPRAGRAPVDLGVLLDWLECFLRPLADRGQVRVERGARLDGVVVLADRSRLEQVLLNLALNSFQFMPGGGILRLSGRAASRGERRGPCLEIADSGAGIAPAHLPRIFEAGFTTRAGSPGLGLAVCKAMMEEHQGTIAVASSPGEGSLFTLQFPFLGVCP